MEYEKRKVSELIPNQNNVRKHNNSQIKEFVKSIEKFDTIRPIVIDENNVILAGHGLCEALKSMGREEADVIVKKGLSENDKKKLLLADNKIFSLGIDDYGVIESILTELGEKSDFDIPGYDSDTLEELYGIKGVEQEVAENGTPVSKALEGMATEGDDKKDDGEVKDAEDPKPSKAVEKAREEAGDRKFVICPNCGERIWL